MLKNYITIAFRNLLRSKGYTFISSIGLALGVACALLLFLLVDFHLSFDRYHTKADRIYRINTDSYLPNGDIEHTPGTPFPMAEALRNDFPELEAVAPIFNINGQISLNLPMDVNRFQEEALVFAGQDFLQVFDIDWLEGSRKNALDEPNSVVLAKALADKYFGNTSPLGQVISLDNNIDLKVTGVVADPPANSSLPYRMLISYETTKEYLRLIGIDDDDRSDWGSTNSSSQVYLLLPEGMYPAQIEGRLPEFNKKYKSGRTLEDEHNSLQALKEVHLDERYGYFSDKFSRSEAWSLSMVGLFLVLIACVNFVNLATAQALKRGKEVGIRKVLGGKREQLIAQFMGETTLIVFASLLLSLAVVQMVLPAFNRFIELDLALDFAFGGSLLTFLTVLLIIISLVAGGYPAVLLSGFQPAKVLKSNAGTIKVGGLSVRRSLVGLQFMIAQVLIVATLVVLFQNRFLINSPMGFNKEAIINVPIPDSDRTKLDAFRARLSQLPEVGMASYSFEAPASNSTWSSNFVYDTMPQSAAFSVQIMMADAQYIDTYGLTLLAGRTIQESDTIREFVVNETLLQKLGITDPNDILGKSLSLGEQYDPKPIVGVIEDFHQSSLRGTINPLLITSQNTDYSLAGIKLVGSAALEPALQGIEEAWTATYPEYVYDYNFLDESIAGFYEGEKRTGQLLGGLSGMAIFIACLGLYGLVTFNVNQRQKEVGIRKVLGASSGSIVWLFSKEFTRLVFIAFAIAGPLAAYVMYNWLQNFAYRISLNPLFFLSALFLMLLIAGLTVGFKSRRAALSNPVESLRSE